MRRFAFPLAIALLTFTVGVLFGAFGYARRGHINNHPREQPEVTQKQSVTGREGEEWPLTAPLVSRALQTRIITTKQLRRNSDDEIVWRWLKQSIVEYPQDWPSLKIAESDHYFVVIYRADVLDTVSLRYHNKKLKARNLPLLKAEKRYAKLQVNVGDIDCPNWTGLVDLEEARLVYFEGHSA